MPYTICQRHGTVDLKYPPSYPLEVLFGMQMEISGRPRRQMTTICPNREIITILSYGKYKRRMACGIFRFL